MRTRKVRPSKRRLRKEERQRSTSQRETTTEAPQEIQSQSPHNQQPMNSTPQPLVSLPGTVPLTEALLRTWDRASIIRWCNLSTNLTAPIPPWKLYTMPIHDLVHQHGVPKT